MTRYRQILYAIKRDARYAANLDWGEPRPGHPEGTVRDHLAEVEPNLDALRPKLSDDEYWKLMLLFKKCGVKAGFVSGAIQSFYPKSSTSTPSTHAHTLPHRHAAHHTGRV